MYWSEDSIASSSDGSGHCTGRRHQPGGSREVACHVQTKLILDNLASLASSHVMIVAGFQRLAVKPG
jgi:hypothetical protein